MKNQINKVNVEKASVNSKANSLIALDVLKSVKEKNQGLFKTSLGTKTEIYKKELFEGANEKQIKSLRKKFRNVTFNFLSTIANNADKKLIEGFIDFYKQVYTLNDFSFNSIASENTKEEKKAILIMPNKIGINKINLLTSIVAIVFLLNYRYFFSKVFATFESSFIK